MLLLNKISNSSIVIYTFFCLFKYTNLKGPAGWHGGSQRCQVDVSALLSSLGLSHSLHNEAR